VVAHPSNARRKIKQRPKGMKFRFPNKRNLDIFVLMEFA